jgi:hypothetical protein
MHTRHRLGAANTDSAYYTFWQQILGDTEGTINAYLTSRAITHAQRRTVPSVWSAVEQQAGTRYKFSDTDKCPLCHQTDGGGHIASGCQDPIMKRMYTERHNKAGRILLDAIYNGARGSDICMADVGSQQRLTTGRPTSASTTCPRCSPQADQGTESTPGCAPSGQTSCFATRKDTRRKTERGTTSASWSSRPAKTRGRPTS